MRLPRAVLLLLPACLGPALFAADPPEEGAPEGRSHLQDELPVSGRIPGSLVVPFLEVAPELGTGLGIKYIRVDLFGSGHQVELTAETSTEHHQYYEVELFHPASRERPWSLESDLLFWESPNRRFYGLGMKTDDELDESDFQIRDQRIRFGGRFGIGGNWQAGAGIRGRDVDLSRGRVNRVSDLPDRYPNVEGLRGGKILAPWFNVSRDARIFHENAFGVPVQPHEGTYFEAGLEYASRLLGGDSEFVRTWAEGRSFHNVGEGVMAFRLFGERIENRNVPFWELPALGGQEDLRGFFDRRFADDGRLGASVEWRFPLFRRPPHDLIQGLDGVLFSDGGRVFRGSDTFSLADWEQTIGGGLRLILRPGVIARLDLAGSRESTEAYFVFGLPF